MLKLSDFVADESGATALEYALIAGIVSVAIIAGLTGIRNSLTSSFSAVTSGFPQDSP